MPESISGTDLAFERLQSVSPDALEEELKSADPVYAAVAELLLDLRRGNSAGSASPVTRRAVPAARYQIR